MDIYKVLGCKTPLKVYFLGMRSAFYLKNLGDVSDKHGEHFNEDISVTENWFKGKWSVSMHVD